MTQERKIEMLADYLGCDISEIIPTSDDYFDAPDGREYRVLDEGEADSALYDDIESFIDDLGIGGFSEDFRDWIMENALDQSWFEEAEHDSNMFYAEDIESEFDDTYGNRLNQECVDAGIISEDDIVDGEYIGDKELVDELADYMTEDNDKYYEGDWVKWYADNFGWSEVTSVIKEQGIDFDIQAIADEVKDWDGYGNNLATYDGKEIELGEDDGVTVYAFRTN